MGTEIERKFLVRGGDWRHGSKAAAHISQGYLAVEGAASVRVRLTERDAFLTIKSSGAGLERSEFEYRIPRDDAQALIEGFCADSLVVKTRHQVEVDSRIWEIDAFEGANQGLVVAEVELPSPDARFTRPAWLGEEVTGEARYGNARLARQPYQEWPEEAKHGPR